MVPSSRTGTWTSSPTSTARRAATPTSGHPHGDIPELLHIDTAHSDSHGDWTGHSDILAFRIEHTDTHSDSHGDSGIPHTDNAPVPPHTDGPLVPHIDSPGTAHVDAPTVLHADTPGEAHVDTPMVLHADTPETLHADSPETAHIDDPGHWGS